MNYQKNINYILSPDNLCYANYFCKVGGGGAPNICLHSALHCSGFRDSQASLQGPHNHHQKFIHICSIVSLYYLTQLLSIIAWLCRGRERMVWQVTSYILKH